MEYNLYYNKEPFQVYQYDSVAASMTGITYAMVYSDELFVTGLRDDERYLDAGRFTNFVDQLQPHDLSFDLRNLIDMEKHIEAANNCARPWTFRIVQLPRHHRNALLRVTFGLASEVHALEMKMRLT